MNELMTEDLAMDALAGLRPDHASMTDEWADSGRDAVLARVLAEPAIPASSRRLGRGVRRTLLAAAVAAALALTGLGVQALLPAKVAPGLTSAQALDRLASIQVSVTIPDNGYLWTRSNLWSRDPDNPDFNSDCPLNTWTASDGWVWEKREESTSGDPLVYYKRQPIPALISLTGLPSDPADARDWIASAMRTKHPERAALPTGVLVMEVISQQLTDPSTDVATRAQLIRILGTIDGVLVDQHAADPQGRPAIRVTLSDPFDYLSTTDGTSTLFFDPTNGALLAHQATNNGSAAQGETILSSEPVAQLPAEILNTLGSQHTTKWVGPS
jgi:hypothetical protein